MNKREKVFTKKIAERIMKEHDLCPLAVFDALNLPRLESTLTTREKAKEGYESSLQKGSKAITVAFKRWIDLVRTSKQAKEVYIRARKGSKEETMALKKLEKLLAKEIKTAQTLEQAEEVYDSTLRGSEEMTEAWYKWRGFSAKEVEEAETPEEIERAYHRAPEETEERKAAIRKIASFYL